MKGRIKVPCVCGKELIIPVDVEIQERSNYTKVFFTQNKNVICKCVCGLTAELESLPMLPTTGSGQFIVVFSR